MMGISFYPKPIPKPEIHSINEMELWELRGLIQ